MGCHVRSHRRLCRLARSPLPAPPTASYPIGSVGLLARSNERASEWAHAARSVRIVGSFGPLARASERPSERRQAARSIRVVGSVDSLDRANERTRAGRSVRIVGSVGSLARPLQPPAPRSSPSARERAASELAAWVTYSDFGRFPRWFQLFGILLSFVRKWKARN